MVRVQEQERQRQMLLLSHKGKESFQSNRNSNVAPLQLVPWDLQVSKHQLPSGQRNSADYFIVVFRAALSALNSGECGTVTHVSSMLAALGEEMATEKAFYLTPSIDWVIS